MDQAVTLPDIDLGLRRKAQSPNWVCLGHLSALANNPMMVRGLGAIEVTREAMSG